MENGHKPPSSSILSQIAAALDVPVHELYRGAEERAERDRSRRTPPAATILPRQTRLEDAAAAAGALDEFAALLPTMAAADISRVVDLARRLAR